MLKILRKKNQKNQKEQIKIIGLTGGIGSGKTSVSKIFNKFGISIIDADKISRNLTADNGIALAKIQRIFGDAVFLQTRPFLKLNRNVLRENVFNNANNKKLLENILHPLIFKEIKKQIKKNLRNLVEKLQQIRKQKIKKINYLILDVPLLYESPKIQKLCNKIISVECEKNLQIQRVQRRNGLNKNIIENIINAQATSQQRSKIADFIIENNGDFINLENQVQNLHTKFLNF